MPSTTFFSTNRILAIALAMSWIAPALIAESKPAHEKPKIPLEFSGYGELHFSYLTYGANQNRDNGSQKDARFVFDTSRFVAAIEGKLPNDLEFEVEAEFEHGGTGAAVELEYEEFGEYESEVEHGGEVYLEDIYLKKEFGETFYLKAGRIPVLVGYLSQNHIPYQYLGGYRPESETTLLPDLWHEMGAEFAYNPTSYLSIKTQLVNGLDSTGFSSQYWVAQGHQTRFETIHSRDLAGILRLDVTPTSGVLIGTSTYWGNTSGNRPKADMAKPCDKPNTNEVAPCGFESADLLIADLHSKINIHNVSFQGLVLWGKLENSDLISEKNSRLSNNLNVLRSPVAEQAVATWFELGYDISTLFEMDQTASLMPFYRYEYYDSMYQTAGDIVDNPRFSRRIHRLGLTYHYAHSYFVKLDAGQRQLGASNYRVEKDATLAFSFIY
jgi:hypothetical protein